MKKREVSFYTPQIIHNELVCQFFCSWHAIDCWITTLGFYNVFSTPDRRKIYKLYDQYTHIFSSTLQNALEADRVQIALTEILVKMWWVHITAPNAADAGVITADCKCQYCPLMVPASWCVNPARLENTRQYKPCLQCRCIELMLYWPDHVLHELHTAL